MCCTERKKLIKILFKAADAVFNLYYNKNFFEDRVILIN